MTDRRGLPLDRPDWNRALATAILLFCALVLVQATIHFSGLGELNLIVDFDAFYVVGQMVWDGDLADAYAYDTMSEAQRDFTGTDSFMPWTYPPPFDLVVAPLALVPQGIAFLLFTGGTLLAYVAVLRRLAGSAFGLTLLAIAPALLVNIRIGQNGFLTGALIGAFCLAAIGGRAFAGLPLGLMVIKPHLAVGLAVFVVAARRWGTFIVAGTVTILGLALATLAFGVEIWPAFLGGVREAGDFLKAGQYPLFRMTSLYAALETLGVPPGVALALQAGLGLLACGAVAVAVFRGAPVRRGLGFAALGTLLVSPYSYDYDLTIMGIALALLWPDILARAGRGEVLAVLGLSWFATGAGMTTVALLGAAGSADMTPELANSLSVAGFGYLALLALLARVLWRPEPQLGCATPDRRA